MSADNLGKIIQGVLVEDRGWTCHAVTTADFNFLRTVQKCAKELAKYPDSPSLKRVVPVVVLRAKALLSL